MLLFSLDLRCLLLIRNSRKCLIHALSLEFKGVLAHQSIQFQSECENFIIRILDISKYCSFLTYASSKVFEWYCFSAAHYRANKKMLHFPMIEGWDSQSSLSQVEAVEEGKKVVVLGQVTQKHVEEVVQRKFNSLLVGIKQCYYYHFQEFFHENTMKYLSQMGWFIFLSFQF